MREQYSIQSSLHNHSATYNFCKVCHYIEKVHIKIFKMRAILCILVLFICTFDIADLHGITPKERKQIKIKHLVSKHNHRNKSINVSKSEEKPTFAFIFSTTSKPAKDISGKLVATHNLSKHEVRKKQKYLRKERAKLRILLKSKKSDDNSSEVSSILAKINQINEELKKYGPPYGKKRRRIKKPKNYPTKRNESANILEITTAPNKNYVFQWNMKNDTSLDKIIMKLNKDPEQNFDNDTFKTQSDGFSPPVTEKLQDTLSKKRSDNLSATNNILIESSTSSGEFANNIVKLESIKNNSLTSSPKQITSDIELYNNTESSKILTNNVSNINYASLMVIQSTTMPPVKNLSLDTIISEFNAISDQMNDVMPGVNKYPKINMTKNAVFRKNINRCSIRKGGCAHMCRPKGPRKCICMPGFKLSINTRSCIDINECIQSNGGCNGTCKNTPGSFYCTCPDGLRLSDDQKSCEDINECLLRNGHGPCQGTCTNTYGSYECSCSALTGTRLSTDKHSCEDINECSDNIIGCSHDCVNTLGSAYCTCPDGYMLGEDWKTCTDINECKHEDLQKQCKHGCTNLIGSYRCIEASELQSDQTIIAVSDYIACSPLFPPKHGFLECSRERGLEVKVRTRNGRRRITNRPGTFCKLVCPSGYKSIGKYELTCGYDGRWFGEKIGKCQKYEH